MKRPIKVASRVVVGLVLCLVAFGVCSAQGALGTPKAHMPVANAVPFALVERIAIKKAQERWGQVAPGPAIPLCDDDGDIEAYMFPFAVGASAFPAYSEIISGVQDGRRIAAQGLAAMTETDQRMVKERARGAATPDSGQSGPSWGDPATDAAAERVAKKIGRERMIGADQFGTIVVAARYDRFPIPVYMHYLPPYFYTGDVAMERAKAALSSPAVTLERVYFLGRNRGQYFEFASSGGSVLIHAFDMDVVSPENALTRKGKKRAPGPNTAARISDEWLKIRKELGE